MPKFFDDYSNTYLTHDSAAGRKQQRRGWKFRENFKLHYDEHLKEWRSGPMGLAAAQQAYMRANSQNPHAVPPLPEGWEEEEDPATGGTKFYVNTNTQERTWVRPGFIPPAAGGPPPPHMNMMGPPPPNMMRGPPPPNMNMGGNMFPPPGTRPNAVPGGGGPPPPPMGNFPPPPGSFPPPPSGAFPPPPGGPPGAFPPPPMHGLPPPGSK